MTSADEIANELRARIRATPKDPARIGELLDRLSADERLAATRALEPRDQRKLWYAVEGHRPLRLTSLVPAELPALEPVRYYGRNSMPIFKLFEKRFYRAPDVDAQAPRELCGGDFSALAPVSGIGYFVATPHADGTEVKVEYQRVPAVAPEAWPRLRSNRHGLAFFIYAFTVDFVRAVSTHVAIGAATWNGKEVGYFVLCREASA